MDNGSENSEKLLQQLLSLLSSTKKIKTGSTKQTSGQTNTGIVLGDMVNGISEEALSRWFAKLREQIQRDNDYMQEAVTNAIDSVLVSKVAKIVAEAYHTHCLGDASEKKELKLTLRDIQNKAGSITTEIQAVIKECNGTKEKVDELVRRLNSLNEEIKAELRNILDLCEKILSEIRFANERIGKLTTLAKENKVAIADLKEIVLSYIQLAEQHHEESQRILASQNEKSSSPGLDEQTILAMRVWFDKISHDISERSISAEEIIGSIENQKQILKDEFEKVQKSLKGIRDLIDQYGSASGKQLEELKEQLSQKAQETLQRQAELYSLALDTNERVKHLEQKVDQLVQIERAQERVQRQMDSTADDKDREELATKYKELDLQYKQAIHELEQTRRGLEIEKSNGEITENLPCLFCGYKAKRKVIGGDCKCDVCGQRYVNIDPDIHGVEETQTSEAEEWRKLHTAQLEKVGDNLYRMNLRSHAVSREGVLIIPSKVDYPKDCEEEAVKQIDFCQPNTDDEEGRKQLLKVKKLFLEGGIKIGEFHDVVPFSEIGKGLEKVMKWDGNGFIEDEGTLKKIKGEVANDA